MSKSSKSTKDKRDIYYRQSKAEGYRARSAFKLIHLDEQFGFLSTSGQSLRERFLKTSASSTNCHQEQALGSSSSKLSPETRDAFDFSATSIDPSNSKRFPSPPSKVVDLCAAPGSWSQVLRQRLPSSSKIVAVDLQPMAPISGVTCIQGDITREQTAREVEQALSSASKSNDCRAELIVCDGANDVTGLGFLDEILQAQLLLAALQISLRLLSPNGCFISKIFTHVSDTSRRDFGSQNDGNSGSLLKIQFKTLFEVVEIVKPISSRAGSGEHFLVCIGFRPPKGLGYGLDGDIFDHVSLLKRAERVLGGGDGSKSKEEENLKHVIPCISSGDLSGYDQTDDVK